ncbi:MAG: hypothetical protein ACREAC_26405, partial [Blastocatellia bacterium]
GPSSITNNVVSANGLDGMDLSNGDVGGTNTNSIVDGNMVGTDAAGTHALGNAVVGINLQADSWTVSNNVVSGNGTSQPLFGGGIRVQGGQSLILTANKIGCDTTGSNPLPNEFGVDSNGPFTIGGTNPGDGNVIAFNTHEGVGLLNNQTQVLGNSIFSNQGGGIVLINNTPNLAAPVLLSASGTGSMTVTGTLNAPAGTYRLEFFSNAACDPSGSGQGQIFLGFYSFSNSGGGAQPFTAT